jgi:hypothetical protein
MSDDLTQMLDYKQYSQCTLGYGIIVFLAVLAVYGNIILALLLGAITIYAANRIEIERRNNNGEEFRAEAGNNFCCINKNGLKCYDTDCPGKCDCVNSRDITSRTKPGGSSLAAMFMARANQNPKNFYGIS